MAPTKIGLYSMALVFLFTNSYGQESRKILLNEFTLSVNRTRVADFNTENRCGFGLGVYHAFFPEKKTNLMLGIEYNRVSQYKESMRAGHWGRLEDVTYTMNWLSFPFGLRLSTGEEIKPFIEFGIFTDLAASAKRKGKKTIHRPSPDPSKYIYETIEIDDYIDAGLYMGFYLAFGIRIIISRLELIIKPEYKHSLNNPDPAEDYIYNRYFRIAIGLRRN